MDLTPKPAALPAPAPGETALRADAAPVPRAQRIEGLAAQHFDFVWRLLRRHGLSPHEADDAAQEVFLLAVKHAARIEEGKERSFLIGTAIRVGMAQRRAARREISAELPETRDARPIADELLAEKRLREQLDALLAELGDDERAVLILADIEGLTAPEVSEALGLPLGTVASRLRRAREQFQAGLKRAHARASFRGGRP